MRLFFTVELSRDLSTQLIDYQSSIELEDARPVPPANFHITLSFLGETSERQLDDILSNLQEPELSPFEVRIGDLIFWQKQGIVALGVEDPDDNLARLKSNLESQLNHLSIRQFDKKDFVPHITLFRKALQPPKHNVPFSAKLKVNRVSLMHSQKARDGVFYDSVESWTLVSEQSIKSQLLGKI